jgi:hypothetical protein
MNIIRILPVLLLSLVASPCTHATLAPLAPNNFAPSATLLDFSGIASGTEVNALSINNVLFQVTENGLLTNGAVIVDAGPGTTNNIVPPNLVSLSNPSGLALVVSLPNSVTQFGYGYAILTKSPVSAATTIQLFAGLAPVGSLDFAGSPDPKFTGGFAGLSSTVPFDRAVLTFSTLGEGFAVDNVTFATTVPEQERTLILFAIGVFGLLSFYFRRSLLL